MAREALRPEIQALRALAVAAVVAYHLFPDAVPGGFIGVDVFFVISGFLITAHLLREVERTGRVALAQFWARRARRILPAALLVLLATTVATVLLVPQVKWGQYFAEIRASTVYGQNWQLALDAVDYLAAENEPSPVQHFWSLSAEEQFYLAWPLLIVVAAWFVRTGGARARRGAILAVLGSAALASFVYGVMLTASDPARAFFVTPTRAWEFAAGGLLAVIGAGAVRRPVLGAALSWAGLGVIAYGVLELSGATPFPGTAALIPVLGAVVVIAAGAPRHALAPTRALAFAPVQWLGGVSYSVYLWHWPLLVLWPFALGEQPESAGKGAIVAATLALAWLTKVLVEDPVRASGWLRRHRPRWTLGAVLAASACVLGAVEVGQAQLDAAADRDLALAERLLAGQPACFGAASIDAENPCDNPALTTSVVPTPVVASRLENAPCEELPPVGLLEPCAFGVPATRARKTIAVIGDSHARHWRAALEVVARRKGWEGISLARTSCPFSTAERFLDEPERSRCARVNAAIPLWLRSHPEIDTVFVAAIAGAAVVRRPGRELRETSVAGYAEAMRSLPPSVRRIVVLRDTPFVRSQTAGCITMALNAGQDAGAACAVPRSDAIRFDAQAEAATRVGPRAQVVDFSDALCGLTTCRPVLGGALVYKDAHHLTLTFSRTMGPLLARRLDLLAPPVG